MLTMVVLQELCEDRKPYGRSRDYANTLKIQLMKITRSLKPPLETPKICPFRIMFIISYPLIGRLAALKDQNLISGLTNSSIPFDKRPISFRNNLTPSS